MTGPIICAIDHDPEASSAARVAARLAERLETGLTLMHAITTVAPDLVPALPHRVPAGPETARRAAVDAGERLLGEVARESGAPDAELRLERGGAAERACALATEMGAALLVVGSGGKGPLERAILGSVSRAVLSRAPCPVVVVPPDAQRAAPDPASATPTGSVVCGIDGDRGGAHAAETGAALARAFGVSLVLVRVIEPSPSVAPTGASVTPADVERTARPVLHRIEDEVADAGFPPGSCRVRVTVGAAGEQLDAVASEESAELVVVGARRGGRIREAVLGSASMHLVRQGSTPVVVVR